MIATNMKRYGAGRNRYVLLSMLAFLIFSCGPDGEAESVDFDRSGMLESVADGLIIPNFLTLQSSVNRLSEATRAFGESPTTETLKSLRSEWQQAVIDHQHCSAYGFGPGALLLGSYAEVLGVFPVNQEKIEENIINPDFDLPNSFDRDVRGFHTIEYLIYGDEMSMEDIIASYDSDRMNYLNLVMDELKTTIDAIVEEWQGSYRSNFIQNDGTSAGSPISMYYNGFVRDYENLKNFKVELPAGLTADQEAADGSLFPGYYSGMTRPLIEEHMKSSEDIYRGLSREGDELIGFDDYLEAVEGGAALVSSTYDALDQIDEAIRNLPSDPLTSQADVPQLKDLHTALQANTANFKSSIVSLLGLTITFNSGDGD